MSPVLAALLTLLSLGAEAVSILRDGETCYNVTSIESLDRSKMFEGSWIEVLRAANDVEEDEVCGATDYKLNGGDMAILKHMMETGDTSTTGLLEFLDEGSIEVKYQEKNPSSYVVVDTDNNKYAVVYSCQQEGELQERAWILGRNAEKVLLDEVLSNLKENHIRLYNLLENGLGCPKLVTTTEDEGGPMCLDLHNTQNLNVSKVFTNSWIEVLRSDNDVESEGVCGSTQYITKDAMGLLTHKMDTGTPIHATLNFLEDDSIEATYSGGPSSYVVVDTDNDNYAVVYSCEQQPGAALKERAWILGRTVEGVPPQVLTTLQTSEPQLYKMLKEGLSCPKTETTTTSTTSPPTEPPPPPTTTEAPVTPCLDISHANFLDLSKIFGISWVEVLRSANDIEGEACGVTEYSETSDSSKKYVTHNLDTGNTVFGMLEIQADGSIKVNYGNASSSYVVFLTDNNSFAVIYSCQQIAPYLERAWILGIAPYAVPSGVMTYLSTLQPHLYDLLKDGLSCPKQETTTDNGVRTTCLDIHNKENLDLTQIAGTWVEVTRTPNSFEKDFCGSVTYNSHGSAVLLTHTFGGSTVKGQGMVNTTTELQITMRIGGQTSRYYVVDTDYKTFAIVYSCTQLDNNMQEQAWVLSRSGTVDVNFVDTVLQPYGDLDLLLDNGIECKDVVVTTTPDTTTTTEFEPEPITVPGYPYNFYFFYQFRGFNTTQ